MKIKEHYEMVTVGDEQVLVPIGAEARRDHCVYSIRNEAAQLVAILQKKDKTIEELAELMIQEYEVSMDTITLDLQAFFQKLEEYNLLDG